MNRNMLRFIVAVLALGCVPVLAQGDGNKTSASPSKNPRQQLPQVGPSYVIGADDTLLVSVWKEPDLTNSLPVRADGMISMPLLNDVQAAGLTPLQLAASITEKLKQYVEDPHVTVVVTSMNSQKVYLTGEVTRSGVIAVTTGTTEVLASAGFMPSAPAGFMPSAPTVVAQSGEQEEREKVFWVWLEMVKGAERDYKKKRGRYGNLTALRKAHLLRKVFESDTTAGASGKAQADFLPMRMLLQVTALQDGRHFRASIGDRCLSVNADDMGAEWSACCCLSRSLHRDFEDSPEGPIISVAR